MPDVAIKNTGQRVADLEAWAFRTGSDLAGIKETLNDLPTIIREEIVTYTAPMFEEIMNRMATREDLSALSAKVDGLDVKVDGLETKVDGLEVRMGAMEGAMGSMNTRMDSLESSMGSMNTRMDSMEGRMDSMEGKLDLILTRLG
ncbi:hypothetical protein ACIBCT_26455 [Streptosporangium sp. NPDC050855]|uniref:hypothetical protein n=1 Tax=Streptosporangium sp. NPDC050855 TaxID=3366194 RepID=UPI0037930758